MKADSRLMSEMVRVIVAPDMLNCLAAKKSCWSEPCLGATSVGLLALDISECPVLDLVGQDGLKTIDACHAANSSAQPGLDV